MAAMVDPSKLETFRIQQIDASLFEDLEQLGAKPKFWFTLGTQRTMFKADDRGTGEDWAEVIAVEICNLLGLPHVPYQLAHDTRNNLPGVICPYIAFKPLTLVLGNQLMLEVDRNYPADDETKYGVSQHTVSAVAAAVSGLEGVSFHHVRTDVSNGGREQVSFRNQQALAVECCLRMIHRIPFVTYRGDRFDF